MSSLRGPGQEWDKLRGEGELRRMALEKTVAPVTSGGRPIKEEPTMVLSYPKHPLEPLREKIQHHEKRTENYGWLGLLAVFICSSTALLGRRLPSVGEANGFSSSHTAPTVNEVDKYGSESEESALPPYNLAWPSDMEVFDDMMEVYEPTLTERIGQRIGSILARRRERMQRQLEMATNYDPFPATTNCIEPITLDRV
ncbi:MAG TPA: hypothetical protein VFM05_05660 [Candidatus Saccharimonadales bacterium]|nr:hypothetical protein [Candidatus Saccharimonadales bacterium]